MSKEKYPQEKIQEMRNVLWCYVKRNPGLGYCQGMNFLVAIFLQHLDEEEAFWALWYLVECQLPLDYYTTMNGVIVDQRCLEQLLKDQIPAIGKHFRKVEFDCQAIIFQWFVCLFANSLDAEIVAQIWDEFFQNGISVIFQYGLAIFAVLKKKILAWKDNGALFMLFRGINEIITDFKVLKNAKKKIKVSAELIKNQRSFLRPLVCEDYEEQHRKKSTDYNVRNSVDAIKIKFLNKFYLFTGLMKEKGASEYKKGQDENFEDQVVNSSEWNPDWPVCLYDFLYRDKLDTHFAFKSQNLEIVDNYFGNGRGHSGNKIKTRPNSESNSHQSQDFDDLLIERNRHIWKYAHLEQKFKCLFNQNIAEFFLSVIHLSADDPFDELIDNNDKIQGFIEICSELVDRHNLKIFEGFRSCFYQKEGGQEPNFFDEINKMDASDSDFDPFQAEKQESSSFASSKISKKPCSLGGLGNYKTMFDIGNTKLTKCMSISKKIRYYHHSRSVIDHQFKTSKLSMASESADFESGDESEGDFAPKKIARGSLKRNKSFRNPKPRKLISHAQVFRIENRFNLNKIKRKQSLQQKQKVKGSMVEIKKLKTSAMDLMFMQ